MIQIEYNDYDDGCNDLKDDWDDYFEDGDGNYGTNVYVDIMLSLLQLDFHIFFEF